ncbi:MAG: hypothetical protein V7K98_02345 [Nostoc sp.]
MPNSQFPMPNSQCPMPNAQCPIPIKLRLISLHKIQHNSLMHIS